MNEVVVPKVGNGRERVEEFCNRLRLRNREKLPRGEFCPQIAQINAEAVCIMTHAFHPEAEDEFVDALFIAFHRV